MTLLSETLGGNNINQYTPWKFQSIIRNWCGRRKKLIQKAKFLVKNVHIPLFFKIIKLYFCYFLVVIVK